MDENSDIPGGFPTDSNAQGSTLAASSSLSSTNNREPSKLHQLFTSAFRFAGDSLIYLVVVPFFILYKVIGLVLVVLVGYAAPVIRKIQQNRHYKLVKKRNDPTDVARRFVMGFDEVIGNTVGSGTFEADTGSEETAGNERTQTSEREGDDILGSEVALGAETNPTTSDVVGSLGYTDYPNHLIGQSQELEIERPDFLECAYSQALYLVKKEARWLLLYIHSTEHESTEGFIKDVLINQTFLKFVRDHKFLCWGGDIKESESFQVANQFKVNRLPFLGLMCLTVNQTPTASGIQQSAPVLSLVCKIQGSSSVDEVIGRMNRAYEKFNPTVASLRADYEKQYQSRLMRKLQDNAYDKSLRRDKERRLQRERKRKEEEEKVIREKKRKQWIRWRGSILKPEATERGQFARVAIRMPDGHREQFKFDKECSLEELYGYVENKLEGKDIGEGEVSKPEGYEFAYPFKIVSVMPRTEIPVDESTKMEEYNLVYPSGNVIVELTE
ncbi:DEKNAAC101555 [Brettanomyces naardenensis]|uniref:DEKNAAC101555 n=1 Tax=Brettanomyces naardenensis TaxID=13370 RepID=A0A448YI87_BRENA|nr:DEKNAAC101555 [Brettanomyces naardenensis]